MFSRTICNFMRRTIRDNKRIFHTLRNVPKFNCQQYNFIVNYLYLKQHPNPMILKRFKSKKEASEKVDESDDEEDESLDVDDYLQTKNAKIVKAVVPSLRIDAIAKTAFGLSRNTIDKAFYSSNIRVNGKKVLKKSHQVEIGDEIDLIVGRDTKNTNLIIVHRCTLLKAKGNVDSITVRLLRNKSLLIEDYPEPWDGML